MEAETPQASQQSPLKEQLPEYETTAPASPPMEKVTLENFDWFSIPSWEIIDASAIDLNRKYVSFLKGAVPMGLWISERGPEAKRIIADNLSMKERINANVYEIRLTFIYRNGAFRQPGPEFETTDRFLRSAMADAVLAKKHGLVVHLTAGFMPEKGFKSKEDLLKASDKWNGIVAEVSQLAEKYKIEYFNPCGEPDHLIRFDSGLSLSESEVVHLSNEYYSKCISAARKFFKGKLVVQLGDVYSEIKNSIFDLNLAGFDMIGMLTGAHIDETGVQEFKNNLREAISIMEELSKKHNKPWYISEVWIYGDKPVTEEKLQKQAEFFKALFQTLDASDANYSGILIMNWNMEEEDIFASIKDTPAERIVAEYFSEH
ncbi:MAG: hypothetical protein J7L44_03260 [Candidatus Diapherotrites archaeon]|nr:hypothetical protein [Candidatus Diapherotrites archaeon]